MKMKYFLLGIAGVLAFAGALGLIFFLGCEDDWCYVTQWQKVGAADGFERCQSLGFPVAESYPRQCHAGEKIFTEALKPVSTDMIRIAEPLPGALVQSPLLVRGEARGLWYFEASFPVRLRDADGNEIGLIPAQATSDWMTTEFVPFEASLSFDPPLSRTGLLLLEKDNPSGLPEYDDSVSVPIRFR
ncbi:MAG: Gmad2 immunoglobulin-like domain-containing protein [bacterium]|nr:Gmad2 immunoglobulin-like domain-containing protein [bacterium]